jgi:hypothetical protein
MSVPYTNPAVLWSLPPDQFNEWRSVNDLPLLFAYLSTKLPGFGDWLRESGLDAPAFCKIVPTGELFFGTEKRIFLKSQDASERHAFFRRPNALPLLQLPDVAAGDRKEVEPYFCWAKRVLRRKRYFDSDPRGQGKTDSFIYNSWSATAEPLSSRASLFQQFQVLKLGQIVLPNGTMIGRRNLDFVDLDFVEIRGQFHGPWETQIHFSSMREVRIIDALLHHVTLYRCPLPELRARGSEFQNSKFIECDGHSASFEGGRLNRVEFQHGTFLPTFDGTDLLEVEFRPAKSTAPTAVADAFRILRSACQGLGRRREAAAAYYRERVYERKALFNPYLDRREAFPPMRYGGKLKDIYFFWYSGQFADEDAVQYALLVLAFHARVWLTPKYFLRAFAYKVKWLSSLLDWCLWGYGERPGCIFSFALAVILAFTIAFVYGHEGLQQFPKKDLWLNSAYFSIVTFSTLGYGDISPTSNLMKIICAAEALLGAFTMGMVVAGFANRSRY